MPWERPKKMAKKRPKKNQTNKKDHFSKDQAVSPLQLTEGSVMIIFSDTIPITLSSHTHSPSGKARSDLGGEKAGRRGGKGNRIIHAKSLAGSGKVTPISLRKIQN